MIHSYLLNIGKGTTRLLSRILLIAAVGSIPVLAQVTQVTTCGTVIDHPGTYILANDLSCHDSAPVAPVTAARNSFEATLRSLRNPITGSPIVLPNLPSGSDGIDIVSNHVILLLDGHTIDGGGTGQFGITVGLGETPGNSHVQIVGPGTVKGFGAGVQLVQTSFSSVSEVTATNLIADFILAGFSRDCFPGCAATKNILQGNTASNAAFGFLLAQAIDNVGTASRKTPMATTRALA